MSDSDQVGLPQWWSSRPDVDTSGFMAMLHQCSWCDAVAIPAMNEDLRRAVWLQPWVPREKLMEDLGSFRAYRRSACPFCDGVGDLVLECGIVQAANGKDWIRVTDHGGNRQ